MMGDVFLENKNDYPIVHLYLGGYFLQRGYSYNEIQVSLSRKVKRIEDALRNFRQGATYFFESLMKTAEIYYLSDDEIMQLTEFDYLCSLSNEDMGKILESYKNARMEIVRDLIKMDNE